MKRNSNGRWRLAGAAVSLLLVGSMVLRLSDAAFTSTTSNTTNQWTSGNVALTDDDTSAAMFTMTNMTPGDTSTQCITVTYAGTVDATIKLYGSLTADTGLADYVDVVVERGTGGAFGDCTGFTLAATVYTGTLDGFTSTHISFATGAGTWAATGGAPDDTTTYRFTTTLQDANAAQSLSATASFVWEVQST